MLRFLYIILIAALAVVTSCESDYSFRGDSSSIAFSADTLSFDTLFAGKASGTGHLMVYNVSGEDMTIDRIYIANSSSSDFHVNINGCGDGELSDIRLRSGDSLYVFVTVFVRIKDEVYSVTEDDIVVEAGANARKAKLWACGLSARRLTGEIRSDSTLTSDVPYLVEDALIVDTVATLTINEGAEIYCSDGSRIDVEGSIVSCGSIDHHVIFRCARRDDFYYDIPGQWQGISLAVASGSANMRYTEIANSTYGIVADSATSLSLDASIIRDVKKNCVIAFDADVSLVNCVLVNSGESLVNVYGGSTRIVHSTVAGYYRWDSRFDAAVSLSAGGQFPPLRNFLMANSVVVGNQSNELDMSDDVTADNCLFSHCYMRLGTKWKEDSDSRFDAVIVGKEPGFVSHDSNNYHLDSGSPLVGAASDAYLDVVPYDADGVLRNVDGSIDIGAYEYVAQSVDE